MEILERKEELKRICMSNRPEFAAIYGRRRIGKTFQIREFFEYKFDFYATGTANSSLMVIITVI